jgi:hypothetical protein
VGLAGKASASLSGSGFCCKAFSAWRERRYEDTRGHWRRELRLVGQLMGGALSKRISSESLSEVTETEVGEGHGRKSW